MKKLYLFSLWALAFLFYGLSGPGSGHPGLPNLYQRKSQDGTLSVVRAPLERFRVIPIVASGGIGSDEPFSAMARRTAATAAINGCYFDKHTRKPIGDIAWNGRLITWGGFGATWGIRDDGTMEFGYLPKWTRKDYSDYEVGISCIPYLVRDGDVQIRNQVDLVRQGFRDRDVFMRMPRAALGFTANGEILLVTSGSSLYMNEFAQAVRNLGATNAIGLDGGASVGLYYGGRVVASPSRRLATILALVPRH